MMLEKSDISTTKIQQINNISFVKGYNEPNQDLWIQIN